MQYEYTNLCNIIYYYIVLCIVANLTTNLLYYTIVFEHYCTTHYIAVEYSIMCSSTIQYCITVYNYMQTSACLVSLQKTDLTYTRYSRGLSEFSRGTFFRIWTRETRWVGYDLAVISMYRLQHLSFPQTIYLNKTFPG